MTGARSPKVKRSGKTLSIGESIPCGGAIKNKGSQGLFLFGLRNAHGMLNAMKPKKPHAVAVLHNVRSAYNVGAIFRTADAAGISKIYLSGYTPAPVDRFGRARKDISKTALGAEKAVPWETRENIGALLRELKKDGYYCVAVERAPRALDYKKARARSKTAFVFGNEARGLSRAVRLRCDAVIEIPMRGAKESLNVSVAAGIILFRFLDV